MGIPTFPLPVYNPFPGGVDLGTVVVMPTGSNVIYCRSTGPQSADSPALTGKLVSTLAAAIAQCRSGLYDTVVCLPGHSESVATSTMLSGLVAGTRIIGVGRGGNMPVFRWTATGSKWSIAVADVVIHGLRLRMEGASGVVLGIDVRAADVRISGCDIELTSGASNKATVGIEVGLLGTRAEIVGNRFRGLSTTAVTDGVLVSAVLDGVRITDNEMIFASGTTSGNIRFGAVAATNSLVSRNQLANTVAASTACIAYGAAAMTGICSHNNMSVLADNTASAQGVTFGAGALIRCFENYCTDEANKSGILAPAAGT